MNEINEEQSVIDYVAVRIRKEVRKIGFASFIDLAPNLKVDGVGLMTFLNGNKIDEKDVINRVACSDIIRVQYKSCHWRNKSKSDDLWYHDPDREKHLIENISGIGPE